MVTEYNGIFAGLTGCRFVSSDTGQPAKRVIATPFIGTRTRNGSTERGVGVGYWSNLANHEGLYYLFATVESRNPKEYLRALEIINRMEKIDPDVLVACVQAAEKHIEADCSSFKMLKKYQPLQMKNVLEKRAIVFQQPCNHEGLKAIISEFLKCGFPVDDPFAQAPKKEENAPWGIFPGIADAEMSAMSLAI